MTVNLFRPVLALSGRGSPLARFPRLNQQRKTISRHFEAATPAALAALDRTLGRRPELIRALAKQNYAPLETIGFHFEAVTETGKQVLSLNNEGLRLREGKFVYDELSAQAGLLKFSDQWHQALISGYQNLWELWNTAPIGYHTLDPGGIITAVNETEARLLGYTKEEMSGKPIFLFIHPQQRRIARQRFLQKLAGEIVPPVQDRIYIKKDGSPINMSSEDSVIRDSNGKVVGIKTVLVDISRLRELERQVLRLIKQNELGQLAAGFAHEFGNLITPILCSAQAVRRELSTHANPALTAHLNNIIDAAEIAKRVVEEIRSYAQASNNNTLASRIDPRHTARQAINLARESIKSSSPPIRFRLTAKNRWQIEGHEHQVFQTILNLCLNARDALPQGGQISLQLRDVALAAEHKTTGGQIISAGNYVAISVRDNGVGIQPAQIKEVFDPFYTTKEFSSGTGLGLSVLLRIIELHGGGVDLVSRPGKGSRFTLYFPAIEAESDNHA